MGLMVFWGTVISTGVAGMIFGIAGAAIGAFLLRADPCFGRLAGTIAGMAIGYPCGVIIGLTAAKLTFRRRGSMLFGTLGTILGVVVSMLLGESLGINHSPNVTIGSLFAATSLLGTLGFYIGGRRSTSKPPDSTYTGQQHRRG